MLELILKMLGDRAKNSILSTWLTFCIANLWAEIIFCVLSLVGAALWVDLYISYLTDGILTFTSYQPLIKFCKRDDAQVRHWASVYEEAFGTKISELVQDWRSHPSPPEQHQYPSHSVQPQQTQQQEQDQQLFHVHPHMHMHVQHQLTNRRLSNTNSQISIGLGSNSRSPNKHGEPSSSYTNGSANVTSNNNLSHKSASNVAPTSYPLGRTANSSNNRTMAQSSNGFPDPSSTSNSNRDSRISLTTPGLVGQMMGHSGNGNECLNPTLLGKYVDKEPSAQAVSSLSRWPLLAGDSSGIGGAGDSGMQQNGIGQVITGGSGGGNGNGNGTVNAAQRNLTLGDGAQSLPSLKDSGLLDSWGSSRAAVDTPKQASNGLPQQQQPKQQQLLTTLPKTTTLGSSISMAVPSTAQHYTPVHNQDVPDLRPTTLGMPVGMSWLANESR